MLDPGLQEILKAVTARYTAEEVITKREQVREDTNALLRERFLPQGMVIDGLNIVNFHFSKVFNDAIEAKVTAEQNALAAKNKLEQVKFEAQQMVEAANGKAKAIQVEASAIANNVSSAGAETPRSANPTTFLCTFARSASFSCESGSSSLASFIAAPTA